MQKNSPSQIESLSKFISDIVNKEFVSLSKKETSHVDVMPVKDAMAIIKQNSSIIKPILNILKFKGSLSKAAYGRDFAVTQEILEEEFKDLKNPFPEFVFRSSGCISLDLNKCKQLAKSDFLILPLGSKEAVLKGEKTKTIQVAFFLKKVPVNKNK